MKKLFLTILFTLVLCAGASAEIFELKNCKYIDPVAIKANKGVGNISLKIDTIKNQGTWNSSNGKRDFYNISESISPETYYEDFIYNLRESEPDTIIDANNISRRVKLKRKINIKNNGLLIFSKKGEVPRFIFSDKNKSIKNITPTDAFKLFEAKPEEKHINFDKKYDSLYEEIRAQILADQKILPPNKKKKDLINKLELLSKVSRHKDYYAKMYKVVKDLDGLTALHLKTIKKITEVSSDKNIKEIKSLIPEKLLESLLRAYTDVELKKDTLIITEQIND